MGTLYILSSQPAGTFSGQSGETTTPTFTITKASWDISITYFKNWSPFWSLRIEIYRAGADTRPVFSTTVIHFTEPGGRERADLASHPNLPRGSYYLKVYSENLAWTFAIIEWD